MSRKQLGDSFLCMGRKEHREITVPKSKASRHTFDCPGYWALSSGYSLVVIGMRALWAPPAPMLPPTPARLGHSAAATTSLTCHSVRSALQD